MYVAKMTKGNSCWLVARFCVLCPCKQLRSYGDGVVGLHFYPKDLSYVKIGEAQDQPTNPGLQAEWLNRFSGYFYQTNYLLSHSHMALKSVPICFTSHNLQHV